MNKENKNIFEKFDEEFGSVHEDRAMPSGLQTQDNIKSHFRQDYEAMVQALEGEKETEPTEHTPNCKRRVSIIFNHEYCELSEEQEGFNRGIETAIQIIKSRLPNQEDK